MARREWNVTGDGQFGRLAKSAGVRRNPHEYAGTGAIRQKKTPTENGWGFVIGGGGGNAWRYAPRPSLARGSLVEPGTRVLIRTGSQKAKGPPLTGQAFIIWWRRRESNPRPQALRYRLYMLSRVFDLTVCYPTGRKDKQLSR